MKQPKKGRLWLNDGSCVRLRPEYRNHVWSYDFVHCRTDDGQAFRTLNIIDEYSRECLAIRVDRKLNSSNVIDALSDLFILRGVPSFNGAGFAKGSPFGGYGLSGIGREGGVFGLEDFLEIKTIAVQGL